MAPGVATKVIAASCGLTAFAVAVVSGLLVGNEAQTVLIRALVALVVGQIVGMVVGAVGERTVAESIRGYQKTRPIPDGRAPGSAGGAGSAPVATL